MKLDVKAWIEHIMSWVSAPVRLVALSLPSVTIAANGTYTSTTIDISNAVPSGYVAFAVLPRASGSNQVYFYQVGYLGNNKAVIQLRNISSAITVTPMLEVISVRNT